MKQHAALIAALALLAAPYAIWSFSGQPAHLGDDPLDYLMMARHYAPYWPHDAVLAQFAAQSRFPPLYPLILAFTGGAANFYAAHEITTALLFLAVVALYAWLRIERVASAGAAAIALLTLLLPSTWLLALSTQSEFAYLAFSALALTAFALHRRDGAARMLYLAAAATAAAVLTRTIGIALLPPLLLSLLQRRDRQGLIALAIALAPALVWHVAHRPQVGYDAALSIYYGKDFLRHLAPQVLNEALTLRQALSEDLSRWNTLQRFCDLLAIVIIAINVRRALRLHADAVYALGFLGILLVWPYPEVAGRLLWPILPIGLGQIMIAIGGLADARPGWGVRSLVAAGYVAAIVMIVLPTLAFLAERYRTPSLSGIEDVNRYETWYAIDPVAAENRVISIRGLMHAMADVANDVPSGECVISVQPEDVTWFSGRLGVPPPPDAIPSPRFEERLLATGCRYLFMYSASHPMFPMLHPLHRVKDRVDVLEISVIDGLTPEDKKTVAVTARLR